MKMTNPSIDLGHPTPAQDKVPAFQSIEEEADFWDTHDVTDFIDNTSPVVVTTGSDPNDQNDDAALD
jgi:hypothetical protein